MRDWLGAIEVLDSDGPTMRFNIQGTELLDENGDMVGQLHVAPEGGGFAPHLIAPPDGDQAE